MNRTRPVLAGTLFILFLFACGKSDDKSDKQNPENLAAGGNPAIEAISTEIAADPNNPELYASRAELYYENQGYDEAVKDLEKALSIDSTNVDYLHLLADVYLDYYRSRPALLTMERAARLYPERIPTLLKLSEFQLILKQHEASMRTVDRILKQDPQNADAYFMFGMNFKELGDTARAVNSFQKAVDLDADLIDAWINLGQLYAALKKPIAIRYFDSALNIDPTNVATLHAKADYLRDQNQLPEAIELYRRIAVIDPQYEEAFYNAGLLYLELDSVKQAYQQFDLAIKIFPLYVRAYYYRGLAAEMLGDIAQARKDYQQALQLAPDYEKPRQQLENLK